MCRIEMSSYLGPPSSRTIDTGFLASPPASLLPSGQSPVWTASTELVPAQTNKRHLDMEAIDAPTNAAVTRFRAETCIMDAPSRACCAHSPFWAMPARSLVDQRWWKRSSTLCTPSRNLSHEPIEILDG